MRGALVLLLLGTAAHAQVEVDQGAIDALQDRVRFGADLFVGDQIGSVLPGATNDPSEANLTAEQFDDEALRRITNGGAADRAYTAISGGVLTSDALLEEAGVNGFDMRLANTAVTTPNAEVGVDFSAIEGQCTPSAPSTKTVMDHFCEISTIFDQTSCDVTRNVTLDRQDTYRCSTGGEQSTTCGADTIVSCGDLNTTSCIRESVEFVNEATGYRTITWAGNKAIVPAYEHPDGTVVTSITVDFRLKDSFVGEVLMSAHPRYAGTIKSFSFRTEDTSGENWRWYWGLGPPGEWRTGGWRGTFGEFGTGRYDITKDRYTGMHVEYITNPPVNLSGLLIKVEFVGKCCRDVIVEHGQC